ncbi:MAG: hypothetical protein LBN29_13695 [Mediterranea sp.]|jgi:hypothetical protein|nr:hypothetical protein [Mediterranea sp.]
MIEQEQKDDRDIYQAPTISTIIIQLERGILAKPSEAGSQVSDYGTDPTQGGGEGYTGDGSNPYEL